MKDKGSENAMNLIWKQTLFVGDFLLREKKNEFQLEFDFAAARWQKN